MTKKVNVKNPDSAEPKKTDYQCSACGGKFNERYKRCPHCGVEFN